MLQMKGKLREKKKDGQETERENEERKEGWDA